MPFAAKLSVEGFVYTSGKVRNGSKAEVNEGEIQAKCAEMAEIRVVDALLSVSFG